MGRCLRAVAVYSDKDDDRQATGVSEVPVGRHGTAESPEPEEGFVNAVPVFPDQEHLTDGDQSDMTSRTVPENTRAGHSIGSPVRAVDDDLLVYTMTGEHATIFSIDRKSGQSRTRTHLDYETRGIYASHVTATDPFGAADSIAVFIDVTDEDDSPVITVISR